MNTFTIDADNNITVFPSPDAAAAAAAGAQQFNSQQEWAELAASWPAERLVAIWNSLPGEVPVQKFKNVKTAISRIWARLQHMAEPERPPAQSKPKVTKQAAKNVPTKPKSNKKATPAKGARRKAPGKKPEAREGSKTAQVVAMLQRKGGATLTEITATMGWQKHTVRGFIAGTMKKAGFAVESFKPQGGERTYRISR